LPKPTYSLKNKQYYNSKNQMMIMDIEKKGTLLAILTALISGLAIPINKIFVVGLDPVVFTATRAFFIGIGFFLIARTRKEFKLERIKKNFSKYLIIGLIGGGLAFLLFFSGLKLTTSARAAFLHKTLPIFTTIFAFTILKERVSRKQLIALSLMLLGILALYLGKVEPRTFWQNPSLGDLLVISAAILWAIENVVARKIMIAGESNFAVSFFRMFLGSMLLFSIAILLGKINVLLSISLTQILYIFISTSILFGYVFCWYWSIKLINVSKASTILLLAPVISMIGGIMIFGEPTPLLQLIGSGFILSGAYLVSKVKSEFAQAV